MRGYIMQEFRLSYYPDNMDICSRTWDPVIGLQVSSDVTGWLDERLGARSSISWYGEASIRITKLG